MNQLRATYESETTLKARNISTDICNLAIIKRLWFLWKFPGCSFYQTQVCQDKGSQSCYKPRGCVARQNAIPGTLEILSFSQKLLLMPSQKPSSHVQSLPHVKDCASILLPSSSHKEPTTATTICRVFVAECVVSIKKYCSAFGRCENLCHK